ncbi:CPBP family intramembrane metalloprotease [bacterium]|nr:CPBP family intramembrane metalloprotease [bacterium]
MKLHQRILGFPPVRLILILFWAAVFGWLLGLILGFLHSTLGIRFAPGGGPFPELGAGIVQECVMLLALLGAVWLVARFAARRELDEFNPDTATSETFLGIGIGFGFITTIILFEMAAGWYRVVGTNFGDSNVMPYGLLATFLLFVLVAFFEELLFRGVLFRLIEEMFGSPVALLISGLLFGFVHYHNPGATVWSSVLIAIEAGVMLGAMYMVTGRLWMVIGTHLAWNFCLGSLYGSPVSGLSHLPKLLVSETSGPDLWTGGSFGPEAGLPAFILGTLLSIILLSVAWRRGRVHILPVWWTHWRERRRQKLFLAAQAEVLAEIPEELDESEEPERPESSQL